MRLPLLSSNMPLTAQLNRGKRQSSQPSHQGVGGSVGWGRSRSGFPQTGQ